MRAAGRSSSRRSPGSERPTTRRSDCRDRGHRTAYRAREPQRGRSKQEPAPMVLAQPGRELVQVPQLAEWDAEPEQAEVVDREQRMPALVAIPAHQAFDRI